MMRGHFRYTVWDPLLIISQIVTIQAIFYVSLGVWIFLTDIISGHGQSLDQIFLHKIISVKDLQGRCLAGSFILNSLCCSLSLWYFVQRTKLCLDYSVTTHVLHLLGCWAYSGHFPSSLTWWLLNVVCVTITCVCGEFLCMRTEMRAIPLSMSAKADL
ncbi:hypothetical protein JTE90_014945 [Oedothorax gibbosus]|uniref:Protein SYS1 homolog n=1 Tax=Oedothorax gibbosus TaxID=931172 RepID=A0AAV6UZG7_9ARAC|nr:hypothetical protein JTE90_014945 [Oedothorax gibbosus]